MNQLFCVTRNGVSKAKFRAPEHRQHLARNMSYFVGVQGPHWTSPGSDHTVEGALTIPIGNQGEYGACVSFAVTGAIAVCARSSVDMLAPAHLYLLMRDAYGTPDEDCGADSQHAIYSVAAIGVCRESVFPYGTLFDNDGKAVRPSIDALRDARMFSRTDFVAVSSLDAMEQAIRRDCSIFFGSEVDDKIQSYEMGDVLGAPDPSNIIGGHEMLVVGVRFVDGVRQWMIRNSWGEDYGEHGYLWASDEFMTNPSIAGSAFVLLAVA
jgi:hypothetical protein